MKFTTCLLLFALLSNSIYASDNPQVNISKLVKEIKHSSSKDKHILMNKLKIALRQMNIRTRQKVMKDLQKSFASHTNKIPNHASIKSSIRQRNQQHRPRIQQPPLRPNIPRNTPQRGPK